MAKMEILVPIERIEHHILLIRGHKVMLDQDLAQLYGVETRALKQAVRRNKDRFPQDFMFELTWEESEWVRVAREPSQDTSRSQTVILKRGANVKYKHFAFTEQGVAMLSSVLNSRRAVKVNIQIMRTFARLRQMLASNENLARKLAALENKYDTQFKVVFDAIRQLMSPQQPPKRRQIGFRRDESQDK